MPHHNTYRRIEAEVVDPEELERIVSTVLAGRKYLGKQVAWKNEHSPSAAN